MANHKNDADDDNNNNFSDSYNDTEMLDSGR